MTTPSPVNTIAPKKAQTSAHYLLVIARLLRIRQVILLQDPPPNKGSAIYPLNKGSATGAEKLRLIKGPPAASFFLT